MQKINFALCMQIKTCCQLGSRPLSLRTSAFGCGCFVFEAPFTPYLCKKTPPRLAEITCKNQFNAHAEPYCWLGLELCLLMKLMSVSKDRRILQTIEGPIALRLLASTTYNFLLEVLIAVCNKPQTLQKTHNMYHMCWLKRFRDPFRS
jgi:hypothetical protein